MRYIGQTPARVDDGVLVVVTPPLSVASDQSPDRGRFTADVRRPALRHHLRDVRFTAGIITQAQFSVLICVVVVSAVVPTAIALRRYVPHTDETLQRAEDEDEDARPLHYAATATPAFHRPAEREATPLDRAPGLGAE